MGYRRIIVAAALQRYLDLTPIAIRIRDIGGDLAATHGASIHLLSVDAPVDLLPGLETTAEKLDRYAAPIVDRGLEVTTEIKKGRPSRAIEDSVHEVGADLLIMGSHSKRGPIDVGLGSTASAISRELDATVVLVRPTEGEQERAKELMIPKYPLVFPYG
jgi:nucleotide-binding universal stress UspA family protein